MSQESQKHIILGSAGHIDHGKTALIKAMTGIDCDTHAEEKQRGITINLGFAHLDLPSGNAISVVDVPVTSVDTSVVSKPRRVFHPAKAVRFGSAA